MKNTLSKPRTTPDMGYKHLFYLVIIAVACNYAYQGYNNVVNEAFKRGQTACKQERVRKIKVIADSQVESYKREWDGYSKLSGGKLAYTLVRKWWNTF